MDTRTATVSLVFFGKRVHLEFEAPVGPTRPIDMLPLFRTLTDTLVQVTVETAEEAGAKITCRKGCGACCRQLVPISEIEVESIRALVDALPEPRRAEVIARFDRARQQLSEAGLLDTLRAPDRVPSEHLRSLGNVYFEQRIACPFLEDESCSIHQDRPLACREYLVTSPAVCCANPTAETVHLVPMPAQVSRAVHHIEGRTAPDASPWIPMILALEWPQPDERGLSTGTALVENLFQRLTGKPVPSDTR